jgi:hypothetical protein
LEELFLCDNCYLWLCCFQDQFDETALGKQPELMNILHVYLLALLQHNSPFLPEGPAAQALVDLWRRASLLTASPIWKERFVHHFRLYFAACRREAEDRLHTQIPDVSRSMLHRREAAVTFLCFDLIELCLHKSLASAIHASQPLQERLQIARDIVSLVSDVFSLEEALARGKVGNLVLTIVKQEGYTLQVALEHVGRLINEKIRCYQLQLSDLSIFPAENRSDVSRFLHAISHWISGWLCWSSATARHQPDALPPHFDPILPALEPGRFL